MRSAVFGVALAVGVGACASFQDPDIVIDLRVLAITSEPANQVIDISEASTEADVLAQLVPTTVCALTADPGTRQIHWQMTMCNLATDDLCATAANGSNVSPQIPIGSGVIDPPDTTSPEPQLCATIQPDDDLFDVLVNYVEHDDLMGLGGIDYGLYLEVGEVGGDPADDQFAAKELQVMPRIPADIMQNHNPTISGLTAELDDDGSAAPIPLARCADLAAAGTAPQLQVTTDDVVRFTPVEPPGIHESYVVPTIDGGEQMFTEAISYQWNAGSGSFSSGSTGGPVDLFGNPAPLFTDWSAPDPDDIGDTTTDVPLWIIQRDDRLGEAWFESCIRVTPADDSQRTTRTKRAARR